MATTTKQYNQSAAKKLMTYSDLQQSKSITIDNPTVLQQVTLLYLPNEYGNLGIDGVRAVIVGADDPVVRFEIRTSEQRDTSPGKLIGSQNNNVTSTTTGDVFDISDGGLLAAPNNWVWLKITDVQGTVESVTFTFTLRGGTGDTRAVPVTPPPPPPDFNTITWTTVPTAAVGEREIYVATGGVDSYTTFDATHGSASNPFATIACGKSWMRTGHGDRLMLNKGDEWDETLGTWTMSGESSARPMIVMAYGTGARPKLNSGSSNGFSSSGVLSHLWLMGIEIEGSAYNGTDTIYGVAFNPAVHTDILIENCCFHDYRYGIYLSGQQVGSVYTWVGMATNFTVRGNTVTRCYRHVFGYTPQAGVGAGMYTYNINGLLVEFNCFHRNGYIDQTYVNFLRRNVYHDNVNLNAVYRSNLFFGTDGIQLRSGGELTGNVFSQACSAITLGAGSQPVQTTGVSVTCEDNVILDGKDTIPAASIRTSGITISNVTGGTIKRNIIASGGTLSALSTPCAWWFSNTASYLHNCRNTTITDNITHNWGGYCLYFDNPVGNYGVSANTFSGNVFQNPDNDIYYVPEGGRVVQCSPALTSTQFAFSNNTYGQAPTSSVEVSAPGASTFADWFTLTGDSGSVEGEIIYDDADRTIGTYNVTLGGADDHTEFEEACLAMDMDTWDDDYTAPAVVAYIKEGFTEV